MSKYFRPWNIDQTLLLPPNVQDFVPKAKSECDYYECAEACAPARYPGIATNSPDVDLVAFPNAPPFA